MVANVRRIGGGYPRRFNKRGDEGETSPRVLGFADLDLPHGLWGLNIRLADVADG